MFEFLDQDAVDIIFSAEVIFSVVFTLSMFVLVHTLLAFMRQSGTLYTRKAEIEGHLSVLQARIPIRLEQVSILRRSLMPLEDEFKDLRAYHARLNYIEKKAAEKKLEEKRLEMDEEENKVDRKRMGLDRFI